MPLPPRPCNVLWRSPIPGYFPKFASVLNHSLEPFQPGGRFMLTRKSNNVRRRGNGAGAPTQGLHAETQWAVGNVLKQPFLASGKWPPKKSLPHTCTLTVNLPHPHICNQLFVFGFLKASLRGCLHLMVSMSSQQNSLIAFRDAFLGVASIWDGLPVQTGARVFFALHDSSPDSQPNNTNRRPMYVFVM